MKFPAAVFILHQFAIARKFILLICLTGHALYHHFARCAQFAESAHAMSANCPKVRESLSSVLHTATTAPTRANPSRSPSPDVRVQMLRRHGRNVRHAPAHSAIQERRQQTSRRCGTDSRACQRDRSVTTVPSAISDKVFSSSSALVMPGNFGNTLRASSSTVTSPYRLGSASKALRIVASDDFVSAVIPGTSLVSKQIEEHRFLFFENGINFKQCTQHTDVTEIKRDARQTSQLRAKCERVPESPRLLPNRHVRKFLRRFAAAHALHTDRTDAHAARCPRNKDV